MAGGFIIDDLMSILGLEVDGEGGRRNESPGPTFCFEFGAVVSSEEAFCSKVDVDLPRVGGFNLLSLSMIEVSLLSPGGFGIESACTIVETFFVSEGALAT